MIPIRNTPGGIQFAARVQPRAHRNSIVGVVGDALKIAITAQPARGEANQALIEFLADFFNIPRSSVTIASGKTSRLKVVRIRGASDEQLRQRLADVIPE